MTCAFTLLSQVRNPSASCAGRSRQGGRVAAAKVPRMSCESALRFSMIWPSKTMLSASATVNVVPSM
jgi:hypothetical protein